MNGNLILNRFHVILKHDKLFLHYIHHSSCYAILFAFWYVLSLETLLSHAKNVVV